MQILISLYVPDPMMGILQAEAVLAQLKAGNSDGEGQGMGPTFWELHTVEDQYPHGDYRDEEGNLLHVAQDHVIEATLAKHEARQIEPGILVDEWIEMHGKVTFVSAHEDHDHEHDHGEDGHDHG